MVGAKRAGGALGVFAIGDVNLFIVLFFASDTIESVSLRPQLRMKSSRGRHKALRTKYILSMVPVGKFERPLGLRKTAILGRTD
jgi:hypothetical protein